MSIEARLTEVKRVLEEMRQKMPPQLYEGNYRPNPQVASFNKRFEALVALNTQSKNSVIEGELKRLEQGIEKFIQMQDTHLQGVELNKNPPMPSESTPENKGKNASPPKKPLPTPPKAAVAAQNNESMPLRQRSANTAAPPLPNWTQEGSKKVEKQEQKVSPRPR